MRERPFSVLLLDELEKAHPLVNDVFLQILSDGRLTDSRGQTVFFSEAIIIFTSNIGTRAEEILGALTGVALAPADLQAILGGCVTPMPRAVGGRLHQNGWASIDLDGGATLYLQRQGTAWQLRAAKRAGWQIEYPAWQGMFPQVVRLRSDAQAGGVDVSATISQLETNVDLDASAFMVNVPPGTTDMTLDELREAGPLRGSQ